MTTIQGRSGEWNVGEVGQGTSHFYVNPDTGARYAKLYDCIYAMAFDSARYSGDDEEAAEDFAEAEAEFVVANA